MIGITKTKRWFFEKINKINKPLARLTKKKGHKLRISEKKKKISVQNTMTLKG